MNRLHSLQGVFNKFRRHNYKELYQRSLESPEEFWRDAAKDITWSKQFTTVLDPSNPPFYQWFKGGQLNTCYNALDRHVHAGLGSKKAIIYDSPVTNTIQWYTYREVIRKVQELAGVLVQKGVKKGDRVLIYMPMIPETVFAMLACARIGAVHSVVFGGFSAHELCIRIDDAKPVMVFTASCGVEVHRIVNYKQILDEALQEARFKPKNVLVYQRSMLTAPLQDGRDWNWEESVTRVKPFTDCVDVDSSDPSYLLYTSGTSGKPKGILRDTGGHAVALYWSMKNIYNVDKNDVFWAASDVGWVVGHSYIVYGPLLYGCTTVLFEGKPVGTPDAGVYWRVIKDHRVSTLFTAPTALRAIKRDDPQGIFTSKYNLSNLKKIFVAGERCDVYTLKWASELLGKPIYDHYWQTETGWPIIAPCLGLDPNLEVTLGSSNKPVPGFDVQVISKPQQEDDDHYLSTPMKQEADPHEFGPIVVKLPLPPGCLLTLYNDDDGFKNTYLKEYPGFYLTGDAGYKDQDGNVYIMSRTDDIINVAAHRLSTSSMEEVISSHHDVAECAVIGAADTIKGQVPVALIVLKSGVETSHQQVIHECVDLVRQRIGAVASFKTGVVVKRLPKTRSGKVVRNVIRKIADGLKYKVPATIDDIEVISEIHESLKEIGYPLTLTNWK